MKKIFSKISSNRLAIDSLIVFAGTMGANVGSYLYHLLIGRILGPLAYGEISSLFSLLYIFTVPILVGQTVLIKYISAVKAQGSFGQAKTIFVKTSIMLGILCLILTPIVLIGSGTVTDFLHLSDNSSFILLFISLAITLMTIPAISITQGYQKFIWFSMFSAAVVIIKLLFSIPLGPWGVNGMLWATIISTMLIYFLYFIPIRFLLPIPAKPVDISRKDAVKFTIPTLLTLLGITSIYSTDIMLVRHYLPAADAGMYAALAILGKIIFFASSAIAQVSFPVLSEQSALKSVSLRLIRTAVAGVAAMSFCLVLLYFVFPDLIVRMLFGTAYEGAAGYLGLMGIFLSLFSIGNIVSVICLAIGKTKISILPFCLAILQIILVVLFHNSIGQVITINIIVSGLFAAGTLLYITFSKQ